MDWREEVDEIVSKQMRYVFIDSAGQAARFSSAEYDMELKGTLESVIEQAIKKGFIKGHAAGASAALDSLPESTRDVYSFEPTEDAIHAERAYLKMRGEL